jgi:hypothetical protein
MSAELVVAVRARVSAALPPPVTEAAISAAEVKLGFALPCLLRELYRQVGNGHFGPGFGLLSLTDIGDGERSVVELYSELRSDHAEGPSWKWPAGLLAVVDWGCNIFSCLDCLTPSAPVLTYEYVGGPLENSIVPTHYGLESWLQDWLAGVDVFESLYEHAPELDRVITNPFTKAPTVIKGRRLKRS